MSIEETTLALAGIFQAAELVKQVARKGMVDTAPFETSVYSILQLDADSTEAVYGELSGLKLGLGLVRDQLGGKQRDMEIMRYSWGAMFLERKLPRNRDMLNELAEGIGEISEYADDCGLSHPELLSKLARLYSNTISTFDYRIQVTGEPRFLENPANADRVRTLLLAGIRSAVLWRQTGGTRWQLLLSRRKIMDISQQYIEQIRVVEQALRSSSFN